MTQLRIRLTIQAPVEAVFQLYTDAARFNEWQPGVRGIREQTGPLDRPGTTYLLDQPGPELRVRVIHVDAPRLHEQLERVAWYQWLATARFDARSDGSTALAFEATYSVPGRFGWLVAPVVALAGWPIARAELRRLKAVAELDQRARKGR